MTATLVLVQQRASGLAQPLEGLVRAGGLILVGVQRERQRLVRLVDLGVGGVAVHREHVEIVGRIQHAAHRLRLLPPLRDRGEQRGRRLVLKEGERLVGKALRAVAVVQAERVARTGAPLLGRLAVGHGHARSESLERGSVCIIQAPHAGGGNLGTTTVLAPSWLAPRGVLH